MRSLRLGSLLVGLFAFCLQAGPAFSENAKSGGTAASGSTAHHGEGSHAGTPAADAARAAEHREHREHREHLEHRLAEETRQKLVAKFDTNGDGKLDAAELANAKNLVNEYRQQREAALAAGKEFSKIEMLEELLQQLGANNSGNGNSGNGSSSPSANSSGSSPSSGTGSPSSGTGSTGSGTGTATGSTGTPQWTAAQREAFDKARAERHALHELRDGDERHDLHRDEEHRAERHHALLDKFDTNHDGKLDDGERKAARAAIQAHRQARAAAAANHSAKAGAAAKHHHKGK